MTVIMFIVQASGDRIKMRDNFAVEVNAIVFQKCNSFGRE